jgi:aspartate racemase
LDLSGDPSIQQALKSLRQQHLEGRPFQQTPLNQIKAASGVPASRDLFRTLTVFEPGRFFSTLNRLDERWRARKVWSRSHTNYPLCLYTFIEDGALVVQLERDAGLYSTDEADQILQHYVGLLDEIARNPKGKIQSLRMLDRAAYERLTAFEAEREQEPPETTALQQIVDQTRARGAHPAIEAIDGGSITYAELASRIHSNVKALEARGVREGDLVALLLPRSIEAIVAMLALHSLGAAFMLTDPDYPPERIAFMLDDSRARFILVHGASSMVPTTSATVIDIEQFSREVPGPYAGPRTVAPDSLAYVVYTSGSTGTPKGVCVTHGALSHHATTTVDAFQLTPSDRVLQFAALSFDVALEEIFPTLCAGATLVLRNRELAQTSRDFFAAVERHRLTVLNLPTAFWHKLTDSHSQTTWPRCVRLLVVGGEQASVEAHERFRAHRTDWIRWINAYGPTETTITSTFYDDRQSDPDRAVPIGRPHRGVSHFILDQHMRPVPHGVVGQLYIGGCTLARGYLGQQKKTAERFVPHPWREGARLYATGDLVRQTRAGNYVYVDRVDQQVKVRGFRIELGEVEAHLLACQGVDEAAVVVQREPGGDAGLVGFVVGDRDLVALPRIRECLSRALPSHMIPKKIVTLAELPKTPAGKVDRAALSATRLSDQPQTGVQFSVAPNESIERELANIWTRILGRPVADSSTNFFEAGGHSLLVVQLFNEVESRLNRACDAQAFFRDATLEGLAQLVREGIEVERREPILQLAEGDPGIRPLFLAPGVTGLALDYVHLAEALGATIPVYGLRMPGLTKVDVAGDGLRAMARAYARLIGQVQPRGPCALAGYSAGGIVSLAITEQLLELGREVDFLGVLDGTPPASVPFPSPFTSVKRLARLARTTVARLTEIVENKGSIKESARRVLDAAVRAPARWFGRHGTHHQDVSELFREAQVDFSTDDLTSMQAQLDSIMRYRPTKTPTNIVLFRTQFDPFEGPHEPDLGWSRVVGGAVRIEPLAGRHHEVLTPSGAPRLAAAMTPYLRRRAAHPTNVPTSETPNSRVDAS